MEIVLKKIEDQVKDFEIINDTSIKIKGYDTILNRNTFIPNINDINFFKVTKLKDVFYKTPNFHIFSRKSKCKIFIYDESNRFPYIMYNLPINKKIISKNISEIKIEIKDRVNITDEIYDMKLDDMIHNLFSIRYAPLKKIYAKNPGFTTIKLALDYFIEKTAKVSDVNHHLLMDSIQTLLINKYLYTDFNIFDHEVVSENLKIKGFNNDTKTVFFVPEEGQGSEGSVQTESKS